MKRSEQAQVGFLAAAATALGVMVAAMAAPPDRAAHDVTFSQSAWSNVDPHDQLSDRIRGGIYHDGRLWLWSDDAMAWFTSDKSGSVDIGNIVDVRTTPDRLWVLTRVGPKRLRVGTIGRAGLATYGGDLRTGEKPVALLVQSGQPIVLTENFIHRLDPGSRRWRSKRITEDGERACLFTMCEIGDPVAVLSGSSAYVGVNAGEWGGWLHKIDLETGAAEEIDGLSNITAVLADPGEPGCIYAAGGSSHLGMTSGGVAHVCGVELDTRFSQVVPSGPGLFNDGGEEPIYGLARAADGALWAVSDSHIYRIADDGVDRADLMPAQAGITVLSLGDTKMAMVSTDMHRAYSVSGDSPILIALDEAEP